MLSPFYDFILFIYALLHHFSFYSVIHSLVCSLFVQCSHLLAFHSSSSLFHLTLTFLSSQFFIPNTYSYIPFLWSFLFFHLLILCFPLMITSSSTILYSFLLFTPYLSCVDVLLSSPFLSTLHSHPPSLHFSLCDIFHFSFSFKFTFDTSLLILLYCAYSCSSLRFLHAFLTFFFPSFFGLLVFYLIFFSLISSL